jgi:hypothetical protein
MHSRCLARLAIFPLPVAVRASRRHPFRLVAAPSESRGMATEHRHATGSPSQHESERDRQRHVHSLHHASQQTSRRSWSLATSLWRVPQGGPLRRDVWVNLQLISLEIEPTRWIECLCHTNHSALRRGKQFQNRQHCGLPSISLPSPNCHVREMSANARGRTTRSLSLSLFLSLSLSFLSRPYCLLLISGSPPRLAMRVLPSVLYWLNASSNRRADGRHRCGCRTRPPGGRRAGTLA